MLADISTSFESIRLHFFLHFLQEIIRFYCGIGKFSDQQHTSDITLRSIKLTKLTTVLPVLCYFQILSDWEQFKCSL